MLRAGVSHLDALLITHKHYDHTAGIDDLRPYASLRAFPIYANNDSACQIRSMFPYCFGEVKYPGVPNIELCSIEDMKPFVIGDVEVEPIRVYHGALPIVGYRFGRLAYITDMSRIEPQELEKLKGVDVLVINALRYSKPHRSHQTVLEALRVVDYLAPRATYFTHMMHHIGLHAKVEKCLPKNVHFAYDGLVVEV
jgi:phosphoribosyl 1,2-cyclic phosphate phosphodiesterase